MNTILDTWKHEMIYALTALMFVLGLLDWWTTRTILAKGGTELNPVAKKGMDLLGINGFLGVKAVAVAGVTYFVATQNIWFAAGLCAVYVGVVLFNCKSL